jgi:hypothetical protein
MSLQSCDRTRSVPEHPAKLASDEGTFSKREREPITNCRQDRDLSFEARTKVAALRGWISCGFAATAVVKEIRQPKNKKKFGPVLPLLSGRSATSGDPKGRMVAGRLGLALLLLFIGAIALRPVPLLSEQLTPIHRLNRLERQIDHSRQVATKEAGTAVSVRDLLDLRLLHQCPPQLDYVPPDSLPSFLTDLVSGCVSLAPHPPPVLLSKSRRSQPLKI